jgi:flagellar biosynthesis protein FlhG
LLGISPQGNLQNGCTRCKPAAFDVLPAAFGVPELSEMKIETCNLLFSRLKPFIGDYDYVFMDIGAGISDTVQAFVAMAAVRIVTNWPWHAVTSCIWSRFSSVMCARTKK